MQYFGDLGFLQMKFGSSRSSVKRQCRLPCHRFYEGGRVARCVLMFRRYYGVEWGMACSGVVKCFNWRRGYGFISTADGVDIFVHRKDCEGRQPQEGDEVWFDIVEDLRCAKLKAEHCRGGTGSRLPWMSRRPGGKLSWTYSWRFATSFPAPGFGGNGPKVFFLFWEWREQCPKVRAKYHYQWIW